MLNTRSQHLKISEIAPGRVEAVTLHYRPVVYIISALLVFGMGSFLKNDVFRFGEELKWVTHFAYGVWALSAFLFIKAFEKKHLLLSSDIGRIEYRKTGLFGSKKVFPLDALESITLGKTEIHITSSPNVLAYAVVLHFRPNTLDPIGVFFKDIRDPGALQAAQGVAEKIAKTLNREVNAV